MNIEHLQFNKKKSMNNGKNICNNRKFIYS